MITLAGDVGFHTEKFFRASFKNQGFTDKIFIPWKKKKGGKKTRSFGDGGKIAGKAILVKSGNMRRQVYRTQSSQGQNFVLEFGNTVPYFKVHNDGFKGTVTIPEHTRRLFTKVKTKFVTKKGKTQNTTVKTQKAVVKVSSHSRKMDIPRRRVIGPSVVLSKEIETMMAKTGNKLLTGKK